MGIFDSFDDMRTHTRSKTPKHIKGIRCDVKSCSYHDGDNYCTANQVAIGPGFAVSCTDTVCATFKPKSSL